MKQKRIILFLSAIILGVMLFYSPSIYSSADGANQVQPASTRNRSDEIKAEEVQIQFANKSTQLGAEASVVGNGNGSAYPSFEININLSKLSSPGGVDKDHPEDQTNYPKTEEDLRLKEGDFLLIPIPKEVELRDYFFANKDKPFYLEEEINGKKIRHAVVTKVVEKDLATNEIKTQHLKVTFNENVNNKDFVRANIKFESTVKIIQDGNIDFNFDIFGKEVKLTINAKKKFVYIDHILKKDAANVEEVENGEFGIFKFTLLGNRRQKEPLNQVIIRDQLENASPKRAFEFENIGFDKTSFIIEEGNFSPNEEKTIIDPKRIYSTSQLTYPSEVGVYDDKEGTFSFDDGKIILSFDKKENPHKFELLVKEPGKKGYKVSYGVKVPASEIGRGYVLANNYSMLDENLEEMPLGYTDKDAKPVVKKELNFLASGTITSSLKGRILIKKQEKDTLNPIENAVFGIFKNDEATALEQKPTDKNGNVVFDKLDLGQNEQNPIVYKIKEISAPNGYVELDPNQVLASVSLYKGDPNSYDDTKKWGKIDELVKVVNTRKTIDIKVEKIWAGEGAEEQDVTFTLKRKIKGSHEALETFAQDTVQVSKVLMKDQDASNNFVVFEKLHQYNENNEEYEYYVSESPVDGYQSSGEALVVQDPADQVWKAVITNTKNQPPVQPQPPKPQDSTPSEPSEGSGDNGSGTIPKVEKNEPKKEEQPKPQPKPEEPKVEQPKPEEPKVEQPKSEEPESEGPVTEVSTEKINVDGSTIDKNKTDVLPGSIPNTSSQKEDKNKTAVDPQNTKKLPKTGEGVNSSAYAVMLALLGLAFTGFGVYKRVKLTK